MKLYRFPWSPFVHKVQTVLDLAGFTYEAVDVAYCDRDELSALTGGYVYVPVLVDDAGRVVTESRTICEHLLADQRAAHLVPESLEAAAWAYHDFSDHVLEDITFKIASPATRRKFRRAGERALYTMNKERKFGAGCVDRWEQEQPEMLERVRHFLSPSLRVLRRTPFLFGDQPTLADASLAMHTRMMSYADPDLVERLSPVLREHDDRLVAVAAARLA